MKKLLCFGLFFTLFFAPIIAQNCVLDSVTITYTGSIQTFTVPSCITSVTIETYGAQGGGAVGGLGARMAGTFTVTHGQTLNILVGGQGIVGSDGAGGGGGTFVADILNNPWIVAGGGGGQGLGGVPGRPGDTNLYGTNGTIPASGGTGGNNGGGGGGSSDNGSCISSGGGGGFCGNGGEGSNSGSPGTGGIGCMNGGNASGTLCLTNGGMSYLNGGAGGIGCNYGGCTGVSGGFGGGGGTAGGGGAAGGGYSGGGGGGWASGSSAGGGGGSFNGGTQQSNADSFQLGNGFVIIRYCLAPDFSDSISATGAICYGADNGTASVMASGGTSPFTYSWLPVGGSANRATGLSAGTYTAVIADAGGCTTSSSITVTQPNAIITAISSIPVDSACPGQHVTLNATGASTYLWSNGATSSSIIVVIPQGDTAYYGVKGFIGPCSDSTFIKVKIIPPINASISPLHDTICPLGNATLMAVGSGGQATYKWNTGATSSIINVNPSITTTYTATVYGLCDSVQKPVTITVVPLSVAVFSGGNWRCKGIKDTVTVSGGTTCLWSNGTTKTTYYTSGINADSSIYVTLKNSHGCPVQDTFKIILRAPPVVTFTSNPTVCAGQCVTLTAITSDSNSTFTWSNNQATTDTTTVCPIKDSNFSVTVSNGCKTSKTIPVKIYAPSLFACCDTIINKGDTALLTANSSSKCQWAPNTALNCDTCLNVKASPTVTTTYTITAIDGNNCLDVTEVTVTVEIMCFDFTVPNVFTPNNDGINDVFVIMPQTPVRTGTGGPKGALNFEAYSITIYDRWGKEMYKSSNPSQPWNGDTESGTNASDGVYYYIITSTCQGKNYDKEGFVQLIR